MTFPLSARQIRPYSTKISTRFNAASLSYDKVSHVQQNCANILVSQLRQKFPDLSLDSILDVGTGTGYVPEILLPNFPKSQYTLNDLATHMLDQAQAKFSGDTQVQLMPGDFDTLSFDPHDLIISNMALQWSNDLEKTLKKLYQSAQTLAFSTLLDGSFQAWAAYFEQQKLPSPLHTYPSAERLQTFLSTLQPIEADYHIQEFRLHFPDAHAVMRYLKSLGASAGTYDLSTTQIKKLLRGERQNFEIRYHVFFGILKRI